MKNKLMKSNVVDLYSKESEDLLERINKNGGFLTIDSDHLRKISGHHRLGKNINSIIKKSLSKRGISYYPEDLRPNQNKKIRLYIKSSHAGSIIDAVLSANNDSDNLIHELSNLSLTKKLKDELEIREENITLPNNLFFEENEKNKKILSILSSFHTKPESLHSV
jgi:hypothetical protein